MKQYLVCIWNKQQCIIKRPLKKETLTVFISNFQSAAALSSPLNISLGIRPIQMIFGSYLLLAWENVLTSINFTFIKVT